MLQIKNYFSIESFLKKLSGKKYIFAGYLPAGRQGYCYLILPKNRPRGYFLRIFIIFSLIFF
ncbi:MAG: hypothetical protein COW72_03490 [Candidatus Nealsonbacteria bacterium CG18_big_fil_WC_8_21_14_2_50_37_10]|uniref:Uncharacterized protein n=1 Tax=Candidatus Nealsonbacteria bacterium CG18_big_fil_WC_8_21_14_2_50_37_10 TaxID=1974717 RepID=A0A2H0FCW0_9BACT|nr:MAG: hypothetical protein COW72_03490 [Candidatus Nealsonbacteria bacterium CG18_big_fil_WC_8_21_14_2_50_37_10]